MYTRVRAPPTNRIWRRCMLVARRSGGCASQGVCTACFTRGLREQHPLFGVLASHLILSTCPYTRFESHFCITKSLSDQYVKRRKQNPTFGRKYNKNKKKLLPARQQDGEINKNAKANDVRDKQNPARTKFGLMHQHTHEHTCTHTHTEECVQERVRERKASGAMATGGGRTPEQTLTGIRKRKL